MRELYKPKDSTVLYSYDIAQQTINLSGNWDFDGDNIKDSIFFIGNGGVHLYFHPRIILSKNKKVWDIQWMALDFPILGTANELGKDDKFPQIVMHDFNNDGKIDIYLSIDNKFSSIPKQWQKKGVSSYRLLLTFKRAELNVTNYKK